MRERERETGVMNDGVCSCERERDGCIDGVCVCS